MLLGRVLHLFIFKERRKGEREGEKHRLIASRMPPTGEGSWPATQACALVGNWTSDPLVCRLVLNPLSHNTSQGRAHAFEFASAPGQQGSQMSVFSFSSLQFMCFPFLFLCIDFREREMPVCCSIYLSIHWWFLVYVLTKDPTCNFGVSDNTLTNWATWPGQVFSF